MLRRPPQFELEGAPPRAEGGASPNEGLEALQRARQSRIRCLCWTALSVFFCLWAVLIPLIVEWDFRRDVAEDAALTSRDTDTFKEFTRNLPGSSSSQSVTYSIYYFDVQNARQIMFEGAKPIVVERGPYTYKEYFEKFDVHFDSGRRRVHYYEQKYYVFDPSRSCAGCDDEKDVITTIDIVAASLLEKTVFNGIGEKEVIKGVLCEGQRTNAQNLGVDFDGMSLLAKKTVHDAHWGMWGDSSLLLLAEVGDALGLANSSLSSFAPGFETNYTSKEMTRRLSGSQDSVKTGGKKLARAREAMRYVEYEGANVVRVCLSPTIPANETLRWPAACDPQQPHWNETEAAVHGWSLAYATPWASRVSGGSASFLKPRGFDAAQFGRGSYFKNAKDFWIFVSDQFSYRGSPHAAIFVDSVFREIDFERTLEDGRISRHRIPLERYQIQRKAQFKAGTPRTVQYDQLTTPYGVLNLTRAAGLPLYASQPHFYDADQALTAAVIGVIPNRARHNTYLDVEPRSGEVVSIKERLQFNALLWNYDLPGLVSPPPADRDESVARCLLTADNWTLPNRVGQNGTLNQQPVVLPIGYIEQGYELSSSDITDLADDLQDVDLISRLGFGLCLLASFVCAIMAIANCPAGSCAQVMHLCCSPKWCPLHQSNPSEDNDNDTDADLLSGSRASRASAEDHQLDEPLL